MIKLDKTIYIDGRPVIGDSISPYVIAEIGTNHDRDIEKAKYMIREISKSGCNCVKFQIYEGNEIVNSTINCSDYGLDHLYGDISAQKMFDKHLKTPKEWFPELISLAHELDMHCMATIHGRNGIDWAVKYEFDMIKVASMDHTNIPLLEMMVEQIKVPILISFGMARLKDIDLAMEVLLQHEPGVAMFYCVAVYPPKAGDIALSNILFLKDRYAVPVGFSDHTKNTTVACAALAYGAAMFEKHVTPDHTLPGPDHPFALEFPQLSEYVSNIQETYGFIGKDGFQEPSDGEINNRKNYLKSVIVNKNMKTGDVLTVDDIYLARPGTGIEPRFFESIVNSSLCRDVAAESVLEWGDLGRSAPFAS
ncbi:MAG: hypothetical protein OFPI_07880 [Osedax symbiont Rs2]|nr:MAG: hypothetical protein OFPI_07880 [Osedax symbiont Rs2]